MIDQTIKEALLKNYSEDYRVKKAVKEAQLDLINALLHAKQQQRIMVEIGQDMYSDIRIEEYDTDIENYKEMKSLYLFHSE